MSGLNEVVASALARQARSSWSSYYLRLTGFCPPKTPCESYYALRESYAAGTISLGAFEVQVEVLLRAGL